MTDIVERLRIRQPLLGTLCDEAADKIEQLRRDGHALLADKNAEIEQLTELNSCLVSQRIENEAEIEQLRTAAEDAWIILNAMDVHIDNPFYRRVIRTMKRLSHTLESKP